MFGLYIHVPFCATRCGYCDFNTYTPGELGGNGYDIPGYLNALEKELEMATARVNREAQTVFIGGGTPSLLGAENLGRILKRVKNTFGLAPDAEVTTESNPESTSPEYFAGIREAGFNRVSLGMQSAAPHVLQVLERAHTPGRAFDAAREAQNAGFDHVNLDMIYATPTETDEDCVRTVEKAIATGVDHVSAYSLIVERGTRMYRKVKKGELPAPDEDVVAHRYRLIANALESAGFDWYEVSNWAKPGGECEHNLVYWRDGNWWGAGPGAHSHVHDKRFYNVKHPARYFRMLSENTLPIGGSEDLTAADRHTERIMLGLRLKEGVPRDWLALTTTLQSYLDRGLLLASDDRIKVSDEGRLLADGIVADLLVAEEERV